MESVSYRESGRPIDSRQTRYLNWRAVVPETMGEGQLAFVCSYPIGANPRQIAGLVIEP